PLVSDIDKKTELGPGLNSVDFKRFSQTKCQFDETGTYFGNLPFLILNSCLGARFSFAILANRR
ncbi:hypothetical protein, partial [Streptococcus halichoeri]|uniref:hypothetical protein n=1 Tax=Streptococcus halichoeri TaxID=254785 RepID=UPI001F43CE51